MSEFAPPTGPPPPKVPEGWKAVWNDQYKEWFYVNLHTKQSTWEKPTEPAPNPQSYAPGDEPPPSYIAGSGAAPQVSDTKQPLDSNNPYNNSNGKLEGETDEQLARRLQAEENTRLNNPGGGVAAAASATAAGVGGDRGASDAYYNTGQNYPQHQSSGMQGAYPQPQPQQSSSSSDRGLLSKIKNKLSGSRPQQGYGGYPQQQHGYGGGYGGYPPPQHGYGGYGGGMGGYPQQAMYARRKPGMGAGGAAALGVGGGLLGGMMIGNAMGGYGQNEYQEGYQDGQMDDGGYDDGGGFDGGDFGGGDF